MRLRINVHAIARHRMLLLGLTLCACFALPARALAQAGVDASQTPAPPDSAAPAETAAPVDPADAVDEADPAAAGDITISEDDVVTLQDTLKDLGYFFGPADGRKGPRTRTALRNFQRDQGLAVTGSFDQETVARIDEQARMAQTEHRPAADAAPSPAVASGGGGGQSRARRVGGALKTGVSAVGTGAKTGVSAVGTGAKTGAKAVGTAGRATGGAFGTAGRAVGTAGYQTGRAGAIAGKAVADSTVFVYNTGRRAILGDHSDRDNVSDEKLRAAIVRQYADDERIVPGEIEVRVSKGNVTLALPEGSRSDVAHAVRIAKLTPGVQSVTSVFTNVSETAGAQP